MLLDLGKLISAIKKGGGLKSQLKSFKGTDVSCLLRLCILLLINRASEIFLLNLLCFYPKLTIVKSSRVTRA